ncbi:uncharacterized protein [Rutidosis leptorrhynchoides]|uniref:uncharacterized protein n=1 Tax=Rutidosis leptorrhynchoides TaxID=125765 RepID=UPI003A98FD1A
MMMGTSNKSSSSSSSSNLNPPNVFTATQWEELEQQALIYKYMISGVPVPSDLILSVRRSLYNSTFSSSSSSLGMWEGSLQYNQLYGYGRKIDLEPGRCRRTDGKKWRCAKEAYPDSKYCEKHMHRGRNRSRKPVEFSSSSTSITTATTLNVSSSPPSLTISNSLVDTSNHTNIMDYRYLQGMKDFGDDGRSAANYFQLTNHQINYSDQFNFQNLNEHQNKQEEEPKKLNETKQPFHHFLATPRTTPNTNHEPNWVDVDQLNNTPKFSLSTQDLLESKPTSYWYK